MTSNRTPSSRYSPHRERQALPPLAIFSLTVERLPWCEVGMNALRVTSLLFVSVALAASSADAQPCRSEASALSDAKAIAGVRATIARQCPCGFYDGSTAAKKHGKFVKCANTVINDAADGSPLLGGYALRKECRSEVRKIYARAACGYATARVMCCEATPGRKKASAKKPSKCVDSPSGVVTRNACYSSPFGPDACSGNATNACARPVIQETVDIPSGGAAGAHARQPGRDGDQPEAARPVRRRQLQPEQRALHSLPPRGAGHAARRDPRSSCRASRAAPTTSRSSPRTSSRASQRRGLRRSRCGPSTGARTSSRTRRVSTIAEEFLDAHIGARLALRRRADAAAHPAPGRGPEPARGVLRHPGRRAVHRRAGRTSSSRATSTPSSKRRARRRRNQNVFLGGHSAGTGFTARYAATDFNLTGVGRPNPGYAKLRGLVLLEGGGGSTGGAPLTADTLDRIEAKFDGGLFGAVRDNAPRCVDGTTPCTIANEATDCAGQVPPKCTPPDDGVLRRPRPAEPAHPRRRRSRRPSRASPIPTPAERSLAVDRRVARSRQQRHRQGARPRQLSALLAARDRRTAASAPSSTTTASSPTLAPFVATSVGAPGPTVGGLQTWQRHHRRPHCRPRCSPTTARRRRRCPARAGDRRRRSPASIAWPSNFYAGRHQLHRLVLPELRAQRDRVTGVCTARHLHRRQRRRVLLDRRRVLAVDQPRLDRALDRPRPARHREPDAGGEHRHPGDRVRRHQRPRDRCRAATRRSRSSIGTCTAPSCDGTPRVVDADHAQPRVPDLRRRQRRLRGRHGGGLRPPRRGHRRGRPRQPDPGRARRVPEAQHTVTPRDHVSGRGTARKSLPSLGRGGVPRPAEPARQTCRRSQARARPEATVVR